MPEETDEALMLRIGQGDSRAFSLLVGRHMARVVGMAWRMTGSRADGEDIAQESFARVWTNAPRWRPVDEGGALFSTWLYRVAMNLCIDRRRRPKTEALEEAGEPADEHENALRTVENKQVSAEVARAISGLPERQRAALVLCFYEGLTNVEAADALSLSVGAVESLLVRARRALKARLQPLYDTLGET